MALPNAQPHIATLLDLCAARQTEITTFARGESSKPAPLSYSELHALVTQMADFLRQYQDPPGEHYLGLSLRSRPLRNSPVNNSEGRVSHFKHLHRLLLDPIVITKQELVSTDFAENDILRVVAVEDVEGLRRPNSDAAARTQADSSAGIHLNCLPNGIIDDRIDKLSNISTNDLANCIANGPKNSHTAVSINCSMSQTINDHMKSHTNGALRSLQRVAVLMLTSGSTGNAKAVCLTHKQILAAF